MTPQTHTPGPWQVLPAEADKPYLRIRGTRLGKRWKIANVLDAGYKDQPQFETDETSANAALVAAAPDLLAACEATEAFWAGRVRHLGELSDEATTLRNLVRAAIAKAKGAQ